MFKKIPLFDGRFIIDENGTVINTYTNHILTPYIACGYWYIRLYYNRKTYYFRLHRLVAMVFIPNPNNYPIVMHKDNNRLNCSADNLKWGTISENTKQAVDDGLFKPVGSRKRQYYEVDNGVVSFRFLGVDSVANTVGYKTKQVRHYMEHNKPLPLTDKPFSGFKVHKSNNQIDSYTFNDHLLTGEVEPQAKAEEKS